MENRKGKTILIVDDEPNIVVAVEFLMEKEGYNIRKCYDGQSALASINEVVPDLILLDVMMPGMDGFEVAKKIRENQDWENLKIIFLTAKGTREDKMKGYANGGEIYLTKPFDNDNLVIAVNEAIEFG
ncbi:MAG: response regulator [Saprospiraceae bacterium]